MKQREGVTTFLVLLDWFQKKENSDGKEKKEKKNNCNAAPRRERVD